jgi:hypothetical protein
MDVPMPRLHGRKGTAMPPTFPTDTPENSDVVCKFAKVLNNFKVFIIVITLLIGLESGLSTVDKLDDFLLASQAVGVKYNIYAYFRLSTTRCSAFVE